MMNPASAAAPLMEPSTYQPHRKNNNIQTLQNKCQREEDTKEIAGFLLSLKHRSVTPEPLESTETNAQSHQPLAYPPLFNYGPVSSAYEQPFLPSRPYETEESYVYDNRAAATPFINEQSPGMTDMPWDVLLGDSKLVFLKDRDLVPDSLFVAMAQMKRCQLTDSDRVGCYKARDLGFTGFCCKHCGGQPGFGKYFPASVRSLAQTTTSQTILKHIGNKCRFCPPHVRQAVNELQRQQAIREGSNNGRPRYGSRKIFFQRIWGRLHGGPAVPEEDDGGSHDTPSDIEEASATTDDQEADDLSSSSASLKRKSRFGVLPTQRNKRIKAPEAESNITR